MTREPLLYNVRRDGPANYQGFDPEKPIAGWYRMRLRSGGMPVAVRIWHGAPVEPWTGEEMDRAPRWNASTNGDWIELDRVWPQCADEPIDQAEAEHLMNLQRWGAENGHAALADPRKRLDPLSSPLLF